MASILIIDDERPIRNTLKEILEYEKFKVDEAEDGPSGLEKIKSGKYDLIMCDIKMPVMDGWEFMNNVRTTLKMDDIPAIALTSLDSEEAKKKAIENGFNFYEVKLDRERFMRTVDLALADKK